jgi:shikimate kinase
MDNVILIGMPGVGKSTVGVILAKLIGYRFIDTDLIIQEKCDALLKTVIENEGVDGFIETENRICASVNASRSVIATGGSAVYGKEAMEHFRAIGTVVYLDQDFDVIDKRLSDIKGRGVVLHEGQTLLDLYNERDPLYRKHAHVICKMTQGSVEENVCAVMKALEDHAVKI